MDTEPPYYEVDPEGDVILNLQSNNTPKESPASDQSQSEPEASPPKESSTTIVRMLLSSKHLTLASIYFRNMFKGNWLEGRQPDNNEKLQLYEEGSDVQPLLILMSIIHGRSTQIPHTVDLPMLTNIATLVDYYKCTEAVEIVAELWISRLESQIPKLCGQLIEGSPTPVSVDKYPIPDNIISSLNQRRQSSITGMIKALGLVHKRFRQKKLRCKHRACREKLIGRLSIHMEELNIFPGDAARLPARLSFRSVADCILGVTWLPCNDCDMKDTIITPIKNAEKKLRGLKLSDFRSSEP